MFKVIINNYLFLIILFQQMAATDQDDTELDEEVAKL